MHRGLYMGISLIRMSPPPSDRHRALGIVLLYGARGGAVSYERGTPVRFTRTANSDSTDVARSRRAGVRRVVLSSVNVQWFRGGLVLEAHRLFYHSA